VPTHSWESWLTLHLWTARIEQIPVLLFFLWVIPNALCAGTLVVAWRRKSLGRFPFFFTYLGLNALQVAIALAIPLRFEWFYEWFVVFSAIVGFALEIAVIYELARRVVFAGSSFANMLRPLPRWSAATLLLVATFLSAATEQTMHSVPTRAYLSISMTLNFLDFGLLLLLLLLSRTLGISWGILEGGAALGIAISDAGCLAGAVLMSRFGFGFVEEMIRFGSYNMAVVIWIAAIFIDEKRSARRSELASLEIDRNRCYVLTGEIV